MDLLSRRAGASKGCEQGRHPARRTLPLLGVVATPIGQTRSYFEMLQRFYCGTSPRHVLNLRGTCAESICVRSEARQGCPLSTLLFSLYVDILPRRVASAFSGDNIMRAVEDDTAVVVGYCWVSMPALCKLFTEFAKISGLHLNDTKMVFTPLLCSSDSAPLQKVTAESTLAWKNCLRVAHPAEAIGGRRKVSC